MKHFQLKSIVTVVAQVQTVKQSEQMNSISVHTYIAISILSALPPHDTDLQSNKHQIPICWNESAVVLILACVTFPQHRL